ncbi:hypothetical protein VCUG_00956 [Vavraia culicis subsp. floridensis]|uniref:EF-hand domain-containing protein n=1 Tax=Vavraia culicis (isolate floridensis) TaxID=948595 RepID=L2GWR1_VAVCU|nr:uncharacterized protein VCUG_00956 [Vavraia culicis subsp. floridensis]ELA47525.1 hypothetical protein VCUG_00956 [Vavraia culicis subsp. floridensis]
MSLREKYDFFTKDESLTKDSLFDLLSLCNRVPPPMDGLSSLPSTFEEFERLATSCREMNNRKDLLKHLVAFNKGSVCMEKEQFEKFLSIGEEFSEEHKEELYKFVNVKDDMINLEEFVEQITGEVDN